MRQLPRAAAVVTAAALAFSTVAAAPAPVTDHKAHHEEGHEQGPNERANDRARERGQEKDRDEVVEPEVDSRVVTAVIDSGANPYHDHFRAGSAIYPDGAEPSAVTPEVLEEFGIDEDHVLSLTRTGDFAADYAADAALWAAVEPGELYWFEGTNLMAISFDPGERIILPDDESDTHGVGTTASVLNANPESIVILVEGITTDAESWAFTTPGVDLVSTSYGWPGSPPLGFHLEDSFRGAMEFGNIHVGAADNSPALSPFDGTSGPWWVVGVAGFHEGGSEGRAHVSGSLPDFLADFHQTLPYCAECESGGERGVSGTSFATPTTAGTLSKVILEARRAVDHDGGVLIDETGATPPLMIAGEDADGLPVAITSWQVRRALEEAAYVPTSAEYDPAGIGGDGRFPGLPVNDDAPWLQVGWGVVTPDPEHAVVDETLAHLGFGTPMRFKDQDTCDFMTDNIEARHLYWDNLALFSQSWLAEFEDPYVYC